MSEISEDLKCLRYYFTHGLSTGGSTIKLARMARMMYIATFVAITIILILVGK